MIANCKLKKRGFTIIELMVVMTIIGLLATLALLGLSKGQAAARDVQRQRTMKGIQEALARYYGDNQSYPAPANSAQQSFGCMLYTLNICGYLSSYPTDPNTPSTSPVNLACSSGFGASFSYTGSCGSNLVVTCSSSGWTAPSVPGNVTEGPPKGNATWCGGENGASKTWGEGYNYVSSDANHQTYQMLLDQESGGLVYFNNP